MAASRMQYAFSKDIALAASVRPAARNAARHDVVPIDEQVGDANWPFDAFQISQRLARRTDASCGQGEQIVWLA